MTTKKELTGNIARMEKELEEMKASLENMPDDKPPRDGVALDWGGDRFVVDGVGNIAILQSKHYWPDSTLRHGSTFTTREAAEKEVQRRKLVQRMRVAANEAGGVDWEDTSTEKYYPKYRLGGKCNKLRVCCKWIRSSQLPHFPTEESLETFMDSLSKEEQKLLICGLD